MAGHRGRRGMALAVLACMGMACPAARPADAPGALHVPSPDWRDQVIYFAMIDRFADGDPRNNDQGEGEFDPRNPAKFSGGDLAGLRQRLDYIRGLGATAIWITPPVANQWWNGVARYGGYHGYWAEDFKRVDAHFGTLRDYQALSRAIHGAGMYLVQDVVVNHTANYYGYAGGWDPQDPAKHFVIHPAANGRTAPARPPFSFNDVRDPRHRAAGIYHWTPDIRDFSDPRQVLDWQLAGLDDLNTENPAVRDALREAYGYWIREAGVDGFRVDTAFYVPPDYFRDFLHSADRHRPGVLRVAAQTGREGFHVFGEGLAMDRAYEDTQARRIDGYMREPGTDPAQGNTLLPGMINFPLYGTLGDVFARGRPTAELAHRIGSMMAVHARPHLMPTFVDNHDVDRFLAGGDEAGLRQALLAIMTLPGIPTIYYGTEQGFREPRASMFAGGHGAQGRDHFDTQAPLYRYLQRAIALRRSNRVLSRGIPEVLAGNRAAPGAIAWRMRDGDESVLVAFNTSGHRVLLDGLDAGDGAAVSLRGLFAIDGEAPALQTDAAGRASAVLPPRAGYVWRVEAATAAAREEAPRITLDAGAPARTRGDLRLSGQAPAARTLKLVVDGDLEHAKTVNVGRDGRWSATVDTRDMVDSGIGHSAVLWDEATGTASARHAFHVARDWQLLAEAEDAAGDDAGPRGTYRYPTDPGWSEHRQADILGVKAWASGGALKLQLRMRDVTAPWNPANGFDHVAFTIYLQLPGRAGGATVMPLQNASLPDGMRWQYRLRAHGWSNVLHAADGATADTEGTLVAPSAGIDADAAADTVTFTLPARALGNPDTLRGARLYVTTWDYDGGYRALAPQAGPHHFGGGDADAPRVMDSAAIVLR